MSHEIQSLAFEPFFTTKDVGEGSGLGLPMVYGFAKQSGGTLTIDSEIGRGTTVKLYLPRTRVSPVEFGEMDLKETPNGNGEAVLVIEDDPDVRDLAVEMLKSLGYAPIEARDAAMAREQLDQNETIHMVLSDVVLPGGTSGPEFAEEMSALRPDLKFAFMSGYSGEAVSKSQIASGRYVLLGKPFKKNELARGIREALNSGPR
jgi:CheY-like chemotaxis protein